METSEYENGTPCWVDLGTPDVAAAAAFYSGLFGWEIEIGPAEMGHYSMATVGGLPVAAIADQQTPGAVYWTTYLSTDDVDATFAKAKAAGVTVFVEPMDVMAFGRMGHSDGWRSSPTPVALRSRSGKPASIEVPDS